MSWNSAERRRITGQGGDFAIKLIAFIGGGTAAFLGVRDVFGLEGPGWAKLLAGFLCLITTLSLVAVLVQDRWRSRRSRYALAMPAMHKAYFHLRDLLASMERGASEDDFAQFLDRAVTAFARAFSVITASHCRVSVKSLYSIDDSQALDVRADAMSLRSLKVRTLARDEGSVSMIGTSDEDGDYVTDNSDYERLLLRESADRSFFCNDLRKLNSTKGSTKMATADKSEESNGKVVAVKAAEKSVDYEIRYPNGEVVGLRVSRTPLRSHRLKRAATQGG